MDNQKRYLLLFIVIFAIGGLAYSFLIPSFETTEFNPDVIEDISKGITTTSTTAQTNNNVEDPKEINNEDTVDVWGSGRQIREWLYVEDAADAIIKCMDLSDGNYLFNIGIGKGISIIDLANLIKKCVGWDGEFNFDTTKPEGVLEKKVDGSIGKDIINWTPKFSLDDGVKKTVEWYKKNYGK